MRVAENHGRDAANNENDFETCSRIKETGDKR